jgi:hypothetical protein
MPSETTRQQHFMSMVHGYQMGHIHSEDLPQGIRAKVKKTARSISKKASGEFAASVKEEDDIDFSVLSFKEYLVAENALIEAFSELTEDDIEDLVEKVGEKVGKDEEYAKNMAAERYARKMKAEREARSKNTKTGAEDEEPAVTKKVTKSAVKRGGKEVDFEDEEPAVTKKVMKDAAKRGGKEVRLEELWAKPFTVPKSKRGMFSGKTVAELESSLAALKKTGPHKEGSPEFTKEKELNFALRAKRGWKKA